MSLGVYKETRGPDPAASQSKNLLRGPAGGLAQPETVGAACGGGRFFFKEHNNVQMLAVTSKARRKLQMPNHKNISFLLSDSWK